MSNQTIEMSNTSGVRVGLTAMAGVLIAIVGFSAPLFHLVDQWGSKKSTATAF